MATRYSLNFRSTAGSWGETPPAGVVLGDAYPASIAGLTCGWNLAVTKGDYASATDARLSGKNGHNSGGNYFRVDLPNGPGTYRLWLASSALTASTISTAFILRDGSGTAFQTVGSTSVTTGNVLDASGAIVSLATYLSTGGTYVEFTATADHVRIERNAAAAVTQYLANVQLEFQVAPLEAATLTDEYGVGAHSGTIYPKEPEGHQIGKVESPVGVQVFSVVGSAATYFTIETRGSSQWLVCTDTRVPDGWSGDVTIRQTTDDETLDTDIALTATTLDREVTGLLGKVTSETLIKRAIVRDVIAAELWAGYVSGSFASEQTSNSPSDLISKVNALTPDGTSWYAIRLQNGTWTGSGYNFSQKDFGTGGLLIEPDTGHDPLIECEFRSCLMRGCHIRGLKFGPWDTGAGKHNFIANIPGSGPYPLFRFDNCRIGAYYAPGFDLANWADWSDFFQWEFAEQVIVHDCVFNGMSNCNAVTGGRIMSFVGNEYQNVARDFHALSTALRFNTPRGVFADDITYCQITDSTAWNNPDIYEGLTGSLTPHGDWFQYRRTTGGAAGAYPTASAGINGSPTTPWVVGYYGFNASENRLYEVVAITGDALLNPASPPTGTGTGIVSGNVTFDYLQEYDLGTTFNILFENNVVHQDGTSINADGNTFPNNQFVINSNSGWNNILNVVAINNIAASGSTRGIKGEVDGDVWAELNTLVAGAQHPLPAGQATISGRNVRAARNIVGYVSGEYVEATTSLMSELNVAANFKAAAVSPQLPEDVMNGPFDYDGTTGWGYATLVDDDTVTAEEFRANIYAILASLDGESGVYLGATWHLIEADISSPYTIVGLRGTFKLVANGVTIVDSDTFTVVES